MVWTGAPAIKASPRSPSRLTGIRAGGGCNRSLVAIERQLSSPVATPSWKVHQYRLCQCGCLARFRLAGCKATALCQVLVRTIMVSRRLPLFRLQGDTARLERSVPILSGHFRHVPLPHIPRHHARCQHQAERAGGEEPQARLAGGGRQRLIRPDHDSKGHDHHISERPFPK